MIRINLLPSAKKAVRSTKSASSSGLSNSSLFWGLGYLMAALALFAICGGVYLYLRGELSEQNAQNQSLLESVTQVEARSVGIDEVESKIAQSRQLEELVAGLNRARLGPTRVLMELSAVLSPGVGPTIDPSELERIEKENPLSIYNRNWDGRRVWLRSFTEEGGRCRIRGMGNSHDDVAEFLRRLAISEVFEQVTLERTQSMEDEGGMVLIDFELTCQVVY